MNPQHYDAQWQEAHKWTNAWSTRVFLCIMSHCFGAIASHLDVGCGDGHITRIVGALGIYAVGADIAVDPSTGDNYALLTHDLRIPLDLGMRFDLVTSLEVAEHLPIEDADTFVDSIIRHIKGQLIFSAAIPGQGGYGHINEQPNEYWINKFAARGLKINHPDTTMFRKQITMIHGPAWWYGQNCMVFGR